MPAWKSVKLITVAIDDSCKVVIFEGSAERLNSDDLADRFGPLDADEFLIQPVVEIR